MCFFFTVMEMGLVGFVRGDGGDGSGFDVGGGGWYYGGGFDECGCGYGWVYGFVPTMILPNWWHGCGLVCQFVPIVMLLDWGSSLGFMGHLVGFGFYVWWW